jgi:arylsulfatase A-like enzyme
MKLAFVLLFSLIFSACADSEKIPERYDLTRNWALTQYGEYQPLHQKDLGNHWKINPNRFSLLQPSDKWKSVQVTFLEDKKFFRNVSKESILLTPGSILEWELARGDYEFHFDLYLFNPDPSKENTLRIKDGATVLGEWKTSELKNNEWVSITQELRIQNSFQIHWDALKGLIFLGNPRLIPKSKTANRPNLILIVIDAMRRDALGCANNKWKVTPNLDNLCKQALLFKNHYANANWTKPSMISFFYGEYASNLGLVNSGFHVHEYEKQVYYSQKHRGLVNSLRDAGYFTQSVMNNVFLLEYTGVGVDLGFHSIEQIGKDNEDTQEITKKSIEFLDKQTNKEPFFLHINYNTPHAPYIPPTEMLAKVNEILNQEGSNPSSMIKKYLGEIYYTDSEIGKIIQKLSDKNILNNTVIAVTSDHGDMFNPSHVFEKNGINGNLFGHGQTLYEDEIAIPLMIYIPEILKSKIKNWVWEKPSSNISLTPTLLGLLDLPETYNGKGIDFTKYFKGKENNFQGEERIYTEGRMMESVIRYPYKYIRLFPGYTNPRLGGSIPPLNKWEEIYNIQIDPEEKINLKDNKNLLQNMRAEMEKEFLQKNAFHLLLPEGNFSGSLYVHGEIYAVKISGEADFNITNRYNLNFSKKNISKTKLSIYTTAPEWKYQLNLFRNGQASPYRFGKWKLPSGEGREQNSYLLQSNNLDFDLENIPLFYNDGNLIGQTSSSENLHLGEEVKNVLKSWGYIHE